MGTSNLRRRVRTLVVVAVALVAGSMFVVPRTSFAAVPTIRFVNAQNGLCIERIGDGIFDSTYILNICNGGTRQQFSLDVPDNVGTPIRHVSSGDCLIQDNRDRDEVAEADCAVPDARTRWDLIFVGGGYRIQNVSSGDFLDGANNTLGSRPRNTTNIQLWRMVNN